MQQLKVLILTPLPIEFNAVHPFLSDLQEPSFEGAANYEHGRFVGKNHEYLVSVREPGMRNVDMALATEKAIQYLNPHIIMLIGIAGGVKDVAIGDIIIPKKVYGYESGKEDADGFKSRPVVESFSGELLARAQAYSRRSDWKNRTADGAPEAKVFMGPVAAGGKVIASTNNPTYQRLKLHFNDTLALEMEAIGFATALQEHRHVHGIIIRGISDLCEGKSETDKQNWQAVAANHAAAFAFEFLFQLNAADFISVKSTPTKHSSSKRNTDNYSGNQAVDDQKKRRLRDWIAEGKIDQVLTELRNLDNNYGSNFQSEITLLSSRWAQYKRETRLGLVSQFETNIVRNQVVAALLELISSI